MKCGPIRSMQTFLKEANKAACIASLASSQFFEMNLEIREYSHERAHASMQSNEHTKRYCPEYIFCVSHKQIHHKHSVPAC